MPFTLEVIIHQKEQGDLIRLPKLPDDTKIHQLYLESFCQDPFENLEIEILLPFTGNLENLLPDILISEVSSFLSRSVVIQTINFQFLRVQSYYEYNKSECGNENHFFLNFPSQQVKFLNQFVNQHLLTFKFSKVKSETKFALLASIMTTQSV
jgi:hypothetical protein